MPHSSSTPRMTVDGEFLDRLDERVQAPPSDACWLSNSRIFSRMISSAPTARPQYANSGQNCQHNPCSAKWNLFNSIHSFCGRSPRRIRGHRSLRFGLGQPADAGNRRETRDGRRIDRDQPAMPDAIQFTTSAMRGRNEQLVRRRTDC